MQFGCFGWHFYLSRAIWGLKGSLNYYTDIKVCVCVCIVKGGALVIRDRQRHIFAGNEDCFSNGWCSFPSADLSLLKFTSFLKDIHGYNGDRRIPTHFNPPFTRLDFLYRHLVLSSCLFYQSCLKRREALSRWLVNRWNNIYILAFYNFNDESCWISSLQRRFVAWKAVLFYSFDMSEAEVCSVPSTVATWMASATRYQFGHW